MAIADAIRETASWEQFACRDSLIHRRHPAAKIFITLLYLLLVASIPSAQLRLLAWFWWYPLALLYWSRTPILPLLKRIALVMPFIIFAGLGAVALNREPTAKFGAITLTLGELTLIALILKTVATVSAALLLTATTRFDEICGQLTRWRVPPVFTLQLAITYRYLGTLLAETGALMTAYQLRSPKRVSILWRDSGAFFGQLLTRSVERAERVYHAMQCRGFNENVAAPNLRSPERGDYAYAASLGGVMLAMRFL